MIKDETSQKYFNNITSGVTHQFIFNVLEDIKKIKPANLLDIGCGTGYITKKFLNLVPEVTACDTDLKRIKIAKKFVGGGAKFVHSDGKSLPFKDREFEVVTCLEVLEHVKDYITLIKECKRVSKKYILFTVPREPIFLLANLLRGKHIRHFGNIPDHINHFNKRRFYKVLSGHVKIKNIKINSFFWISAFCEI